MVLQQAKFKGNLAYNDSLTGYDCGKFVNILFDNSIFGNVAQFSDERKLRVSRKGQFESQESTSWLQLMANSLHGGKDGKKVNKKITTIRTILQA